MQDQDLMHILVDIGLLLEHGPTQQLSMLVTVLVIVLLAQKLLY